MTPWKPRCLASACAPMTAKVPVSLDMAADINDFSSEVFTVVVEHTDN